MDMQTCLIQTTASAISVPITPFFLGIVANHVENINQVSIIIVFVQVAFTKTVCYAHVLLETTIIQKIAQHALPIHFARIQTSSSHALHCLRPLLAHIPINNVSVLMICSAITVRQTHLAWSVPTAVQTIHAPQTVTILHAQQKIRRHASAVHCATRVHIILLCQNQNASAHIQT
jgi:hypothetical protein